MQTCLKIEYACYFKFGPVVQMSFRDIIFSIDDPFCAIFLEGKLGNFSVILSHIWKRGNSKLFSYFSNQTYTVGT